jgi:uncharacterized membrane protein
MSEHRKAAEAPGPKGLKTFGKVLAMLRNRLLAGLAVGVPLVTTVWVLVLAYGFIGQLSRPILHVFGVESPPPGLAFVLTLLVFFGLGVMARNVIGAKVIELVDRIVLRMPLVARLYAGIKQVIDSFKGLGGTAAFQRVVWVDYPAAGHRLIGFVAGQFIDGGSGQEMVMVFVPTSPNPTTGFILAVESDKVQSTTLSLEEASKLIVSCGLVVPTRRR